MENIQNAKTHLSRLVERAAAGEEIIISKANKPMAKLVPYIPPQPIRKGGFLAGKISETEDCWKTDKELLETMVSPPLEPTESTTKVAETPHQYHA